MYFVTIYLTSNSIFCEWKPPKSDVGFRPIFRAYSGCKIQEKQQNVCILIKYKKILNLTCKLKSSGFNGEGGYTPIFIYFFAGNLLVINFVWICMKEKSAASNEFGTYHLCEQRRFGQACASAQSRQNLRCSLIQAVSQEEPSDRKPDPWPFWMAGHALLKFVTTECSKTQIRLTLHKYSGQEKSAITITAIVDGKPINTWNTINLLYEPRQANLCLRAFRHDKF